MSERQIWDEQRGRVGSTEELAGSISLISIVIPVYNENNDKNHLGRFQHALSLQRNIPSGAKLALIFVNNNSTDGTEEIVGRMQIQGGETAVINETERGVGHAMHAGILEANRRREEAGISPDKHIIITTAADTELSQDYVSSVYRGYASKSNLMLSSGPISLEFSRKLFGLFKVLHYPHVVQTLSTGLALRAWFRGECRNIRDYINGPFEIFPGYNVAFRESAYVDFPGNSSAEEDIQRILYEKRSLTGRQIGFIKGQRVRSSGSMFEQDSRYLHPSILKYLLRSLKPGTHRTSSFLEESPTNVVREFINEVDGAALSLKPGERVDRLVGPIIARLLRFMGKEVRLAKEGVYMRRERYGIMSHSL